MRTLNATLFEDSRQATPGTFDQAAHRRTITCKKHLGIGARRPWSWKRVERLQHKVGQFDPKLRAVLDGTLNQVLPLDVLSRERHHVAQSQTSKPQQQDHRTRPPALVGMVADAIGSRNYAGDFLDRVRLNVVWLLRHVGYQALRRILCVPFPLKTEAEERPYDLRFLHPRPAVLVPPQPEGVQVLQGDHIHSGQAQAPQEFGQVAEHADILPLRLIGGAMFLPHVRFDCVGNALPWLLGLPVGVQVLAEFARRPRQVCRLQCLADPVSVLIGTGDPIGTPALAGEEVQPLRPVLTLGSMTALEYEPHLVRPLRVDFPSH